MNYDLAHLTQSPDQDVMGPIQDDEALLLFAICRVVSASRIAEFGALAGYSAANFLAAVAGAPDAMVYSVDQNKPLRLGPKHIPIGKLAKDVQPEDFNCLPLDLVFFDCHDFREQLTAFNRLATAGVISKSTIIAVHDTGPHPAPLVLHEQSVDGGYPHQRAERALVNALQDYGYDCVSFHTSTPAPPVKYRHGLTICKQRHRFIDVV